MLFSKEYVGYLARQVAQKLIAGEFIEAKNVSEISAALNTALLEELQLEDRINDEVRLILEQYQDEMQRAGASYQEMFKKVKGELVANTRRCCETFTRCEQAGPQRGRRLATLNDVEFIEDPNSIRMEARRILKSRWPRKRKSTRLRGRD
jgi:hypothetical protein